jgi:hypothetical protein
VKTVGQNAWENEVYPVQVTQWKKVVRERLPEVFDKPMAADSPNQQELIGQLHEKIGQLSVEVDWL